jgi:hypothetical protein
MGEVKLPPPVIFFTSIIFSNSGMLSQVEAEVCEFLGPVDRRTDVIPFSQSDYYCKEMGPNLNRYFLLFEPLKPRDHLAAIKGATNKVEENHGLLKKRSVNIDPGYIALEHMVLATTKGYNHRIYIGSGIFADLTLVFENGTYRSLPWTYPDYGSMEFISLLNSWREYYKGLLRCQKA